MIQDHRLNNYLRTLIENSPAIAKIYAQTPEVSKADSLNEGTFEVSPGLVHKFKPSVVLLLNGICAAQCSFCERLPTGVGDPNYYSDLTMNALDLDKAISYIRADADIKDVIFSGGDPLNSLSELSVCVQELSKIDHIKTIRIHTKFPLQNPIGMKVKYWLLRDISLCIKAAKKMPYLSLNISHPDEFTKEACNTIWELKDIGYTLISQSVFLKGVNNDVDTLVQMFDLIVENGISPYYLYHCQSKPHTHALGFVENLNEEIAIVRQVFERLPGIYRPTHVIDIEGNQHASGLARGKVTVPHHFSGKEFFDFDRKSFSLSDYI